jgi:hypothetical protein
MLKLKKQVHKNFRSLNIIKYLGLGCVLLLSLPACSVLDKQRDIVPTKGQTAAPLATPKDLNISKKDDDLYVVPNLPKQAGQSKQPVSLLPPV